MIAHFSAQELSGFGARERLSKGVLPWPLLSAELVFAPLLEFAGQRDWVRILATRLDHSELADPQQRLFLMEARIRAGTGDPEGSLGALRRWVASTGSRISRAESLHWMWSDLRGRPEFEQFVDRDN